MKALNDPPEEYEEYYDMALELYGKYNTIVNMVLSPEGSYKSCSKGFAEIDKEMVEVYEQFSAAIPGDHN